MKWDRVWKVLNSNLMILILGSGLGWALVKLVWEPHKERQTVNYRQKTFREEAEFRLFSLESHLESAMFQASAMEGGDTTLSLDPAYMKWSMVSLIYAGWGKDKLNQCYPLIESLSAPSVESNSDPKYREKARTTIARIKANLDLPF